MKKQLEVFVVWHDDDLLKQVPNCPFLTKVNLSNLEIGEYQRNELAEARIFLSSLPENSNAEYVGFVTMRWSEKFYYLIDMDQLNQVPFSEKIVYCASLARNWLDFTYNTHPGIELYLNDLSDYLGLRLDNSKVGFWCNCFICSKKIYLDYQDVVRKGINYLVNKYGYDFCFKDNSAGKNLGNRKIAVIMERLGAMFFTNRNDVVITRLPFRQGIEVPLSLLEFDEFGRDRIQGICSTTNSV